MNNSRFENALNNIDDELISKAAFDTPKKQKHPLFKISPVAACLCLLLCTITVLAATGLGTKIIITYTGRVNSDYKESGYLLEADIIKFDTASFSKEVNQLSDAIIQQIEEYQPYYSYLPNNYVKHFSSSYDAISYIGLDCLNQPDLGLEEQQTSLNVMGNESGDILQLILETDYDAGNINLQTFTYVYTTNYTDEIHISSVVTTEDVEFSENYYTSKNQLNCHIISSTALESGYLCMDGYVVSNGILYQMSISYLKKDATQALDLMHQWADEF